MAPVRGRRRGCGPAFGSVLSGCSGLERPRRRWALPVPLVATLRLAGAVTLTDPHGWQCSARLWRAAA
ncbi:hypothetical protein DGN16_04790 [Xanthomonas citri pv. fuscans]|uniref:Uncharacterized protein n=1 Tax=Xanthomonas citri pv. phaseoli var. fuscans TaxID=473423 RepID=A0A808FGM8_XANCI|nr:hypothetical protein XcvCFBP7112P_04785 [Xanthomonas citri pv. vignicola]QWN02602.1 hypothetical protein DGN16_04790 [Xanthomonas citri pv. fuscans]QWN06851.1 hypothetical protein DGN11_04810 [Xanthomonas citri pv. fuscans]QWN10982.1 hypothetical protein DGN07_04755 [Xanthomonas citri pv. fuscans]QWN19551.1 hypothetical protein DGM98_04805 [Xanthomonas citri]